VGGDNGIGSESEFLDIATAFSDDDTAVRVTEWDGVGA